MYIAAGRPICEYNGNCMTEDGSTQDEGKLVLGAANMSDCVSICDEVKESTACKWIKGLSRCTVLTGSFTHGSGGNKGICWIFEKCKNDGQPKCKFSALKNIYQSSTISNNYRSMIQ